MTTQEAVTLKEKILQGLDKSYEKLVEEKRRTHQPLVVMRGDKVVKIYP